jgi:diguanylate cyclase (GGDEF)-like protein
LAAQGGERGGAMIRPCLAMNRDRLMQPPIDQFRRTVLQVIIAASLLATLGGWYALQARGPLAPALVTVQVVTTVVLSTLFIVAWLRLLPQRVIELCCLLYIVGVCVACMGLRMYSQRYGAGIHLEPLYLWIPLVYVFAFMLTSYRAGLILSLAIFALFVGTSLPYLVHDLAGRYANFTLQLHFASAVLIATLYFFSSYQHRLRLAQATVDQLAHLSDTDDLTGLPNRRHMARAVHTKLADGGGAGFAVMLFDIDRFKEINDELGHGAGDATLVALAARVTQAFRGEDSLGRWGGDEFLALVHGVGPDDAVRRANALCSHVASSPLVGGRQVTISCGVAVVRQDDNIDSLLRRADAALYAAKRAGRNRAEGMLEG